MKVKTALKKMCKSCYIVKKGKKVYVKCKTDPRHKQRQGFSTYNKSEYIISELTGEKTSEFIEENLNIDSLYTQNAIKNILFLPLL